MNVQSGSSSPRAVNLPGVNHRNTIAIDVEKKLKVEEVEKKLKVEETDLKIKKFQISYVSGPSLPPVERAKTWKQNTFHVLNAATAPAVFIPFAFGTLFFYLSVLGTVKVNQANQDVNTFLAHLDDLLDQGAELVNHFTQEVPQDVVNGLNVAIQEFRGGLEIGVNAPVDLSIQQANKLLNALELVSNSFGSGVNQLFANPALRVIVPNPNLIPRVDLPNLIFNNRVNFNFSTIPPFDASSAAIKRPLQPVFRKAQPASDNFFQFARNILVALGCASIPLFAVGTGKLVARLKKIDLSNRPALDKIKKKIEALLDKIAVIKKPSVYIFLLLGLFLILTGVLLKLATEKANEETKKPIDETDEEIAKFFMIINAFSEALINALKLEGSRVTNEFNSQVLSKLISFLNQNIANFGSSCGTVGQTLNQQLIVPMNNLFGAFQANIPLIPANCGISPVTIPSQTFLPDFMQSIPSKLFTIPNFLSIKSIAEGVIGTGYEASKHFANGVISSGAISFAYGTFRAGMEYINLRLNPPSDSAVQIVDSDQEDKLPETIMFKDSEGQPILTLTKVKNES